MRMRMQHLLPPFHDLLYWLILEAVEEAGHMTQLLKALMQVSQYLIVDCWSQQSLEYFEQQEFEPYLMNSWDWKHFHEKIIQYQAEGDSEKAVKTFGDFLRHKDFNKYDAVIIIDWRGSKPKMLPVHIRIKKVKTDKQSEPITLIHSFNLFAIFQNDVPFLKRIQYQLKKLQVSSPQTQISKEPLETLRQKWHEIYPLEQKIQELSQQADRLKSQLRTNPEENLPFDPDHDLPQYYLNRIEFFIYGHCIQKELLP